MAEENNEDEKPFQFQNYSKQKSRKSRVNSQSSEDEPPDLAIDSSSESKPDDIQPGERATNSSGKNTLNYKGLVSLILARGTNANCA